MDEWTDGKMGEWMGGNGGKKRGECMSVCLYVIIQCSY